MTSSEFLEIYPQFQTLVALVPQALAYAANNVAPEVFGATTDQAIGLLAADWLSRHPYGQSTRADDSAGDSEWMQQFKELRARFVVRSFVT